MKYLAQNINFISTLPNATLPDEPEKVEMFSSSSQMVPSDLSFKGHQLTINHSSVSNNYRGTSNSLSTRFILCAPNAKY